ncbi:MAG TPA: sensor histidine kinase [Ferruginibacter sp.]|nr:sensor histidine kinase [Ferruginibacter sp.]
MSKLVLAILVFSLLTPVVACCQSAERIRIDSAKAKVLSYIKGDSAYMNTCFYIADQFMDIDMYDSAQIWLNEIASLVPIKKPTHFNFYLAVNQTITYYYNGLKQIGLKEGERALSIAKQLKDSIYLATAYNISGVFLMNSDSFSKSLSYFKEGIKYCRQPPYAPKYLVISKPHNLYGNLGELFLKMKKYDSARSRLLRSVQLASEIPSYRGVAAAQNLLGILAAEQGLYQDAIGYQHTALQLGLKHRQIDLALIAYGDLAECHQKINQSDSAVFFLKKGFELIQQQPTIINSFFKKDFLEDAIAVSDKINNGALLKEALAKKAALYAGQMDSYDKQVTLLVAASIGNETRAANLEIEDSKKAQSLANTRLIIVLLILISVIVLFLVTRYYHRRQLNEIEIRNRISRDLHDDIGASLSSMNIYGGLAASVWDTQPQESKKMLGKIADISRGLVDRMGDVVWSLKAADDGKQSIETRLRNYASELLSPKDIVCEFDIDEKIAAAITNPETKRNILLIAKEAINNIAKYSGATKAVVSLKQTEGKVFLTISDNGKGLPVENIKQGNGLQNMQQRSKQLNGQCTINSSPGKGVTISCVFPMATISYKP